MKNREKFEKTSSLQQAVIRWKAEDGIGMEDLNFRVGGDGICVKSVVIGKQFEIDYGIWYRLKCDHNWLTREVEIFLDEENQLLLRSDGQGNWLDGAGEPLPFLKGCLDVDLSVTPFSNTLPIRRLNLAKGERRAFQVVHIPIPYLLPFSVTQAYTCLEPGKCYRYECLFRALEADLEVDSYGIVLKYPRRYQRL